MVKEITSNVHRVAVRTVFPDVDFSQALDQIVRTLKPERTLLLTRESSGSEVYKVASQGFPNLQSLQSISAKSLSTLGVSLSNIENVLNSGRAVNCIDADESSFTGATDSVIMTGIRSIICAPISNSQGQTVGVLYADDRKRRGMFSAGHVEWVLSFGKALGGRATVETLQEDMPPPPPASRHDIWTKIRTKGLLAKNLGNLEIAEKCLIRALAYCRCRDLDASYHAKTLNDLAEILRLQEKLEQADQHLTQCLEVVEQSPHIDFRTSVPFRNNLAGLRHAQGREEEAKSLYLQILERLDRKSKKDAAAAVPVLANLGTLHVQSNEPSLGVKYLSRAATLAKAVWGEEHEVFKQCQKKLEECSDFARFGGMRKMT